MKMTMKKLLVLFLAVMLLLTASCAGQGAAKPDPEPGDSQKEALQEIENSSAEPESEEDNADETTPAETEPDETEPEESEPAEQQMVEKNGDIVILYTSDASAVKILFVSKESDPLNIYLQSNRSAMIF